MQLLCQLVSLECTLWLNLDISDSQDSIIYQLSTKCSTLLCWNLNTFGNSLAKSQVFAFKELYNIFLDWLILKSLLWDWILSSLVTSIQLFNLVLGKFYHFFVFNICDNHFHKFSVSHFNYLSLSLTQLTLFNL